MRSHVFYNPRDAFDGVVAAGFTRASGGTSPQVRRALVRAREDWHATAQGCKTPQQVTSIALATADRHGVYGPVLSGLIQVGVLPTDAADDPGYLETAARLAESAGEGAKDMAVRTGAGVERVLTTAIKEGHETLRVGPYGKTIQKFPEEGGATVRKGLEEGGSSVRTGSENLAKFTVGQMVLGGASILGVSYVAGKFLGLI